MSTGPASLVRTWRLVDGFLPGVPVGSVIRIVESGGFYRVMTTRGQMASMLVITTTLEPLPDGRLVVSNDSDVRICLEPTEAELLIPTPTDVPGRQASPGCVLGCAVAALVVGLPLGYLMMWAINLQSYFDDVKQRASAEAQLIIGAVTYPRVACYSDALRVADGRSLPGIVAEFAVTLTNGRSAATDNLWLGVVTHVVTNPVFVSSSEPEARALHDYEYGLAVLGPRLLSGESRTVTWTVLFQTPLDLDPYRAGAFEGGPREFWDSENYLGGHLIGGLDYGTTLRTVNSFPARCP